MKRGIMILLILMISCAPTIENTSDNHVFSGETKNVEKKHWKETLLTNVNTGESFKISDFEGQTVLMESFAVWCPRCLKQQQETKRGGQQEGVVHVNLNVEPNEDEDKVRKHAQENGFDWYYAVSPPEMTKSMIEEFGPGVVSAPTVPLIMVCENGNSRMLPKGNKPNSLIVEEMSKGC